jgi:hypothetical protein
VVGGSGCAEVDGWLGEEALEGPEGDWMLRVLLEKNLLGGMRRWVLEI